MSVPTVSVLITTWNRGDLLRLAVESMLNQTWRDLEVLVVDNGSTDGSIEALRARVADPRLRYELLPKNLGVAGGINRGVACCRGRFIALLDSDDISDPHRLELQLAALAADPGLAGIGSDARVIDGEGRFLGELRLFHAPEDIHRYAAYHMPLHHPTLLLRRELFERLAYREEFEVCSDFDFYARALDAGHRFAALPLMLCDYRRHPTALTLARAERAKLLTAIVRVCTARRAAGRDERLSELKQACEQALAGRVPAWRFYLQLAETGRREGLWIIACLHAALAVRDRPGLRTRLAYARCLLGALLREPRGLRIMLEGVAKGPFWLLLKDRGFPAFPRY